jgi:hypothetical protein|tara:strand:+ start:556 stop:3441 length:2886 start_codon:yes stop_codon:yes gene_type:complete
MRTITQRIPNLLLGISQQPDLRKQPGQVVAADNVYPDYALGLLKRPGGEFVSTLTDASTGGRWFSIVRDTDERYVCQYDNNIFRIWHLDDGDPRMVTMGTPGQNGIPANCNYDNFQTDVVAYNTARETTADALETLNTRQDEFATAQAGRNTTTTSTFVTTTAYPVGGINDAIRTGVRRDEDGNEIFFRNGAVVTGDAFSRGKERTNEQPLLAAEGFRVFELEEEVAATHTAAQLTTATNNLTAARTAYDNAQTAEATALTNLQAEINACDIETIPEGDYLRDADPEDLEFLTINDFTFVLNKARTVAWTDQTTDAAVNEAFVTINVVAYNASYTVTVNGTAVTHNTPSHVDTDDPTQNDANSIATALRNAINNLDNITATVVGPGIYIESTQALRIEASGGSQEDAIVVFQDTISNVSKLPDQCHNGYFVRVVNNVDITEDDLFLEFQTSGELANGNAVVNGPGVWVETTARAINFELDPDTLPHQLVRQENGSFQFGPVDWNDRLVGDDDSNPAPSFIGRTITNMVFYRNRFGFLSGDSVVMSRAGDFFNFFASSGVQAVDDDPIDISASSTRPAVLQYARSSSAGLVLFGERDQFVLSTDGDVLSPTTAKINTLSSFECDDEVEAVSLGTSIAFVAKTPLFTRVFEIADISTERAPTMAQTSVIVPELIPEDVDSFIASSTQSLLSLGTVGENRLFQFRFLPQEEGRVSTWYTWTLTGNLLLQFFDQNTLFAVVETDNQVFLNSYDLSQANEEGRLTLPTGERTDVCLDHFVVNPEKEYDEDDDETTITLPYTRLEDRRLAAIDTSTGSVFYPTATGTTFTLDGDLRGDDIVVGYIYNMDVELPKFFLTESSRNFVSSDFTSDIIIHRIKVAVGLSGPITYRINIDGIDQFDKTIDVAQPYTYELNNVNLSADAVHDVPLYQRNQNLQINIIGDTPFPVSLLAMNWEGRVGNRFYARS